MHLNQVFASENFNSLSADLKTTEKAEIDYIFSLANMTNTDVDGWSVESFMKDGHMLKDRGEINKIFFTEKGDFLDFNFNKKTEKWIRDKAKYFHKKTPAQLKREIDSRTQDIHNVSSEINSYLSQIGEYQRQLNQTTNGVDLSFMKSMEKMSRSPYWSFDNILDNTIWFKSTKDVIIHYVDAEKSIDITHNFGKFQFGIQPSNRTISVKGTPDDPEYILDDRCFHPHVSPNGRVCWGTAANSVAAFIEIGCLDKIAPLLWSLLSTYNPGSPYKKLHCFVEIKKNRKIIENPEEYIKQNPIKPLEAFSEQFNAENSGIGSIDHSSFTFVWTLGNRVIQYRKRPAENYNCLIKSLDCYLSAEKWLTDNHWCVLTNNPLEGSPHYEEPEEACTNCGYISDECECDDGPEF